MDYATVWFLVNIATAQYIGPMPQPACQMASADLRAEGIVCRQASAMKLCPVPGTVPGSNYMACPVFDFPHITQKQN